MAFHHIVGQKRAIHVLQKGLASSRLAQAYLFHGPSSTGKKLTALQFAQALHCPAATTDACETCVPCRKIAAGNHPDVIQIGVEGSSIGIEHIRTLQHRLSYKPYEHQRITIIIDGCEFLTPPAANALLKTLEEPPPYALLLLLTGNKAALPLTLISRCQLVPFRTLTPAHIHTILTRQGVDEDTASLAATLSGGRLEAFDQGDFVQALTTRDKAHTILADIIQAQATAVFLQARTLAGKREQCEALLRWLALLCRDLVMLKITPDRLLYNQDLHQELTPLARHLSVDNLLEAFGCIEQQRGYLGMNLNPQLVFERLLVQLQHLFRESKA